MKKLLGIVVLGLLLSGNAYAKIIELGKCYSLDQYNPLSVKSKWNINDFNILAKYYYRFVDPYKLDSNSRWVVKEDDFADNLDYHNVLIEEGYIPIDLFDKSIITINLNNNLITRVQEISVDRLKITQKEYNLLVNIKKKNPDKWSSVDQKNLDGLYKWMNKHRYIDEFKIETYAAGLIGGRTFDNLQYYNGWAVQIDLDNYIYKMGSYDELNNSTGNFIYACTDKYKTIKVDKGSNKESNSRIKKLLKKLY